MKIKRLPSGNYHTIVYSHTEIVDGKEVRKYESFTDPDRGVVAQMAGEFLANREQMKHGNLTVEQAIDKYIDERKNSLSPSTIAGYKRIKRNNLSPLLPLQMKKITQADVQKAMDDLAKDHSAKTVSNAHGFLSGVIAQYRPNFKLNTTLKPQQKKFKELPQPEDIIAIIKGTELELPAMLAMWLSLTASEMRGIRKSTDIKNGILTVRRTVVDVDGERIEKDAMKEYDRARRLQLPKPIIELINKVDTEYIVPLSLHALSKRWARLVEKSGLEPRITFHDLRHVNASVMHVLGVPEKYAMARGGWKTEAVMKGVYQNTFSAERIRYDQVIDDYFSNVISTAK